MKTAMYSHDGSRMYHGHVVIDRWPLKVFEHSSPGKYRVALTIGAEAHHFLGILGAGAGVSAVVDDFGSLVKVTQ